MASISLWLALMCPLVLSPGPANLCIAGKASQSGFKSTLPLMAGFMTINITLSITVGLLFSALTQNLPILFKTLDLLGALYVCYLGFCFLKIPEQTKTTADSGVKALGFRTAFLMQLVNGKLYPTLIMMFTVFLGAENHTPFQVVLLSSALCLLALLSYLGWSTIGVILHRVLQGKIALFVQHYVFGGILLLIGVNLLVEAVRLF